MNAGKKKKAAGEGRAPVVRWYDARARAALVRAALWLQVPQSKLVVFECLLAQEAQVRRTAVLVFMQYVSHLRLCQKVPRCGSSCF